MKKTKFTSILVVSPYNPLVRGIVPTKIESQKSALDLIKKLRDNANAADLIAASGIFSNFTDVPDNTYSPTTTTETATTAIRDTTTTTESFVEEDPFLVVPQDAYPTTTEASFFPTEEADSAYTDEYFGDEFYSIEFL